jgi:hypothetical protein
MTWNDNLPVIIMMVAAGLLATLFILVRVTIGTKSIEGGVVAMFAKALASVGFIAVGILSLYTGVNNLQAAVFILFGLIMGLIGDIVLDLKTIYLNQKEEGFYLSGGMISFGIGHIFFFIACFTFLGKDILTGSLLGICLAISLVLAAAIILVGKFVLKFDFGKFIVHSCVYAFMLVFMTTVSVAACIVMNSTLMLQFAIGMFLFFLSDIVLTQMYFGGKQKDNLLCIINHVLYYAAQICIAAFICLM